MKKDIILLAESKGFISKILFAFNSEDFPFTTEDEVENFDKLKRYLWLCELQKWLRDIHEINLWPATWGSNNEFYHIEDITKGLGNDMVIVGSGGKGNEDYTIALEEGIYEALTLIKK